jgi:Fe-S-cluster containining protein
MGLFGRVRSLLGGVPEPGAIRIPREAAASAAPHLKTMEGALQALADLPGLARFADEHTLPRAFPGAVAAVREAYDAFGAALIEAVPLAVTCDRGCTHCCREVPTPVRAFELLDLYAAIQPRKGFRRLHNRAADQAARFGDELVRASGGRANVKSDSKAFRSAVMSYRSAAEPCVFLDGQRGACTVYERRPLPCRMHVSIDAPERCDPTTDDVPTTPNLAPPEPLVELMRAVDRRLGLDVSPVLQVGLAELGATVMQGEAIRWEDR